MTLFPRQEVKLTLGTAQFGMNYGITNSQGKPSIEKVSEILDAATRNNIDMFDTASSYGDSELVLGQLSFKISNKEIVTKTPNWKGAPPADCFKQTIDTFSASLEKLRRKKLLGLMVHYAKDLLCDNGTDIWSSMEELKKEGLVEQLGISFYADDPILEMIDKFCPQFVQLPVNVLDQRLVEDGTLKEITGREIEIHLRSVFLQGILLSDPQLLPANLATLSSSLMTFNLHCQNSKVSRSVGALNFVSNLPGVTRLVVGVNSPDELQRICDAHDGTGDVTIDWSDVACRTSQSVDPRYWK
jgi:aryl-alcohol dehydrogenase-like predicted oxidoreductase